MSHWDLRSFWRNRDRGRVRHGGRRTPATLAGRAGTARLGPDGGLGAIERLEGRVLLAVDHPSFEDVFGPPAAIPTVIDVSSGTGEGAGRINFNNDNDMFQFTTSSADFVTLRVDTFNDIASQLDSRVRVFTPDGTQVFASSSNSLAAARQTDAWVGFFANAGTYYVQVLSDLSSGTRATGLYTVRLDVQSDQVDVTSGAGSIEGAITQPLGDAVFRVDVGTTDFITLLADTLATDFGGTATSLNTKIALYSATGVLLASESGNGTLTGTVTITPTDAWIGKLAQAGTYYVRVLSDRANATFGTGAFTLFADVQTDLLSPNTTTGAVTAGNTGTLTRIGEDRVFRVQQPDLPGFDSIAWVAGIASPADLDTHIDLYDAAGNPISSDSTSGNSTNAFATLPVARGGVFYVRIRSDEVGNPATRPSTGNFTVAIDTRATDTPLDPVTRVHSSGHNISNTTPTIFVFQSLSTGTTVMAALAGAGIPLADPAMTLFRADGTVIKFNDDLFGPYPQIDAELVGGERYFIMVDGFDNAGGGAITLNIENLTNINDPGTGFPLDDHANRGDWKNATPIQFISPSQLHPGTAGFLGNPNLPLGYQNGPINDHSRVVIGYQRGRVFANGDSDIFQITPQMDMWGQFIGQELLDNEGEPVEPGRWSPNLLPAARLQILVRGNIDGTLTPTLNVFRSNVLRADPQAAPIATNSNILAALPMTPWSNAGWLAGFLDPAAFPPELSFALGDPIQFAAGRPDLQGNNTIAAWAGEPLFLEVTGQGTGTYEVFVVADAMPDLSNPANPLERNEQISNVNETYGGEPGEAGFSAGFVGELTFGTSFAGDTAYAGAQNRLFDTSAAVERVFLYGDVLPPIPLPPGPAMSQGSANMIYGPPTLSEQNPPYGGAVVLRETALAGIDRIDDKDTYRFRASATGTTEIRINTTALTNTFFEAIANGLLRTTDPKTGDPSGPAEYSEFTVPEDRATYDSLLDATLRIYNADFEQIAFNDDSGVVRGETETQSFGTLGDFIFQRRDPRVVFDVKEGESYFIVVESGQRYKDGSAQRPQDRIYATDDETATGALQSDAIDWRTATGTYQLLLNTMPKSPLNIPGPTQLAQGDDHIDFLDPLVNGVGAFNAVADQATVLLVRPNGSIDANTFTAGSGARYAGTLTNRGLTRDSDLFSFIAGSSGVMSITVARPAGSTVIPAFVVLDDTAGTIANGTASSLGSVTSTFGVTQGEQYFIAVFGGGGSQGRFTLNLTGPEIEDDHADFNKLENGTPLDIRDFLGGGNASGVLEEPGDTDVFTFSAFTTQDVTVRILPVGALNPVVEIYEVQEDDRLGHLILRRIGVATQTTQYSTTFTMTRDRLSSTTSDILDRYYMVVRGFDPESESGAYSIEFSFSPTDDHADREELLDPASRGLATLLLSDTTNGLGDRSGTIEFFYDTDLFVYIAPASGPALFGVDVGDSSTLQPKISIYDTNGTLITSNDPFVTVPVTAQINAVRGQAYYVIVEPSAFLFNPNGTPIDPADLRLTGDYRLNVAGPAVDDHANEGEFDRATVVALDSATGNGAVGTTQAGNPDNPRISPLVDTDLFRFSPRADGLTIVRVASVGNSQLRPAITIFREDGPGVFTQIATDSRNTPGSIQITLANALADVAYYVLVEDVFNNRTGEYRLTIDGQPGGGGTIDPGAVNFNDPDGTIVLNNLTGRGSITSAIDIVGDRDLFTFTALGSGPIFLQVVKADGSTLNASITVLRNPNEQSSSVIAFDASGLPGVTASLTIGGPGSGLVVNEGQQFWVIVDGIGTSVGGYTLRIAGTPASFGSVGEVDFRHRLYIPAGFASDRINEFLSIANPGEQAANYRIVLYYQTGESEVFRDNVNQGVRTIAAGARAGAQLSQRGVGARFNVNPQTPYSLVVESDQPLAANLGRFDFGVTTGEALTDVTAASWYFPRVERQPGAVSDFITLFNPNNFSLNLVLTAYTQNGQQIVIERRGADALPANTRRGFDIDALEQLPIGTFAVKIEASPRSPANNAAYIGIVAALTHFNAAETHGFTTMGDPNAGAVAGAITTISRGRDVDSEVAIFNPGTVSATVVLTGTYFSGGLPNFVKTVQVPAGSVRVFDAKQLGMTNNQTAGIRFTSSSPVSMLVNQVRRGDADAAMAVTQAGTTSFFGAGYLTPAGAGTKYFETLSFYNPAAQAISVNVGILFVSGASTTITVNIQPNSFSSFNLHASNAILTAQGRTAEFSIIATSSSPFASTFSHYDLGLGGGWATNGAPYGLFNPISGILS